MQNKSCKHVGSAKSGGLTTRRLNRFPRIVFQLFFLQSGICFIWHTANKVCGIMTFVIHSFIYSHIIIPMLTTRMLLQIIDSASLARIRTLGPVKVREFVSFMR